MASSLSLTPPSIPLPPNIRQHLPDPMIPWAISERIFAQMQTQTLSSASPYKRVEVFPTDPEWGFVWQLCHHDKPTLYRIARVYAVHKGQQHRIFEQNLQSIEDEAAAFPPTWNTESRANQRAAAIDRWKKATDAFSPFQTMEGDSRRRTWKTARVLPLWHGSSKTASGGICTSGFTYFGKPKIGSSAQTTAGATDPGFFGRGIYLTNSARYAGDIYSRGVIILAWAAMREPFPVVGDPSQQDMQQLKGGGHHKDYNAHYVPVHPESIDPTCAMYYPCKQGEQPFCDEVVVFHKSQTLPRFVVELAVDAPHLMSVSWGPPESVEDLIPHVMALLSDPAVQKDKKSKNALTQSLAQLMQLPGDAYLDDYGFEGLYAKLQQLLAGGKVNRAIAKILASGNVPTPSASASSAAVGPGSAAASAATTAGLPASGYATGSFESDIHQALQASLAKASPAVTAPSSKKPTLKAAPPQAKPSEISGRLFEQMRPQPHTPANLYPKSDAYPISDRSSIVVPVESNTMLEHFQKGAWHVARYAGICFCCPCYIYCCRESISQPGHFSAVQPTPMPGPLFRHT